MIELLDFEAKVQSLSDGALIEQMSILFHREKRMGDAILLGLKEIKVRRLYAAMGYPSLFEFLNKYFKLSESSCYQRLQALKLIESVNAAQESLFKGEVSLSNLASAQSFISQIEKANLKPLSQEDKKALVDVVKNKTSKEAQAALMKTELAIKNPKVSLPVNREKSLIAEHTQLQLTLDKETMEQLNEIRDLLGHTIPSGDYSEILKHLTLKMLETLRKEKGRAFIKKEMNPIKKKITVISKASKNVTDCSTDEKAGTKSGSQLSTKNGDQLNTNEGQFKGFRSRAIPREIKRKAFARAGEQCEHVGLDGHRCESRFKLELDHIIPFSQQGKHELENLSLRCRCHNQFRVKETHGYFYQQNKS